MEELIIYEYGPVSANITRFSKLQRKKQLYQLQLKKNNSGINLDLENYLPYFLIQFPRKLFLLDLEIQRSQYIRPRVAVHKCAETIQGWKPSKGENFMRKYGSYIHNGKTKKIYRFIRHPRLVMHNFIRRLRQMHFWPCFLQTKLQIA